MPLKLKKQRDGVTLRPYWYGEYKVDGKSEVVNLGEFDGIPPASGKVSDAGNGAFEQSRVTAEAKLLKRAAEAHRKGRAEHLTERLIESKTGQAVDHVKVDDLADRWLSGVRKSSITKAHAAMTRTAFERFRLFMAQRNRKAVYLYHITRADAEAYIEALRSVLAPRTARGHASLLQSAYRRFLPVGAVNPFEHITSGRERNGDGTVHRKPFTAAELQALIDTAGDDVMMRDLIKAGACTGLRRGDLCRLRWDAIDMDAGMVEAKASKTGEPVEVPLFDQMRAVVESRQGNGSDYVFPEAARMLEVNPGGLSYRFKKIVALALDAPPDDTATEITDAAEIEAEAVEAVLSNVAEGPRRERMLTALRRYCQGEPFREIEKETGIPRGVISVDMRAIEAMTGKRFVRSVRGRDVKDAIARTTRIARTNGQRAASVRDWHALRTTFVTLALSAGVPMELVRRVTGHATVDIVLRHYFRPGREQFRDALTEKLPDVLTGKTAGDPADSLVALAKKVTDGTATTAEKKRLKALAAKL